MTPQWTNSAIVAVSALIASKVVKAYLEKRKIRLDFDYAMQVVAREAAKRAKAESRVNLDFSPASIASLEEMLGKIHEAHLANPLPEKELMRLSIRWGAYIGEVMKSIRPGKWQRDSKKLGPGTMPLVFDSLNEAFPRSWVYKRIADGPDDNVAVKVQVFANPNLQTLAPNNPPDSPSPIS